MGKGDKNRTEKKTHENHNPRKATRLGAALAAVRRTLNVFVVVTRGRDRLGDLHRTAGHVDVEAAVAVGNENPSDSWKQPMLDCVKPVAFRPRSPFLNRLRMDG